MPVSEETRQAGKQQQLEKDRELAEWFARYAYLKEKEELYERLNGNTNKKKSL